VSITIHTNVASLEAQRHLAKSRRALQTSFNRLSSGYRINSAADDAAGLAISESMKSQLRSYVVAERNAADGISMAQSAEGALGEMHGILARMREVAMQAANGSLSHGDREYLAEEYEALKSEISRIQNSAQFNGHRLVGEAMRGVRFQVGLRDQTADQITIHFGGVDLASTIGAGNSVSGDTATNALAALGLIDDAIDLVSRARARFGSAMNTLEVATSNIQTMRVNLAGANSRIRDVDVAAETAEMSRNQVLSQAGISVLAQANMLPQAAMGLIGG
jgi:flagellin